MVHVKKLHEKYHFAGFSKMVVARNSGFLAMNKRKMQNQCKKTAKTFNKKPPDLLAQIRRLGHSEYLYPKGARIEYHG